MKFPHVVTISTEEYLQAVQCAGLRWRDSIREGRRDSVRPKTWEDALKVHIQGAMGEIAVGKALGTYVPLHVGEFKDGLPDIPPDIGVRWARGETLVVRPYDRDTDRFFLVTGDAPYLTVHGWILGSAAKQTPLHNTGGDMPSVHLIHAHSLNLEWKQNEAVSEAQPTR